MHRSRMRLAGGAAAIAAALTGGMAAAGAQPMTAPAPATEGVTAAVRGKHAGDFVIGFGVIGVLPQNGGSVPLIGGTPTATASVTPQLDFTYFLTDRFALNLIAATTRSDVSVQGSALGDVKLGHVWVLPPTLTLQYHLLPQERFSPYLGLGVNFTAFYSEGGNLTAPVTNVNVRNAWGMAFNIGADYEIAPRWLANFDVKKIAFLKPDVAVDTAVGRINAEATISPWVIGASIRYRF